MADIEDNVPVGRLTGRFVVEVQDNADPDQKAQLVPATGEILVKASIGTLKITDPETGKFITFRGPHRAILDDEGFLCTPYPGTDTVMYRDLVLWSNDSDMLDVKGWTYTATFNLKDSTGRQLTLGAINFELATDQVKDLADAIPTASSPGYGLGLAEQSALRAAQSALVSEQKAVEASSVAQSVRDDADAGEFDGLSAYQIWLGLGNTGTEADFINWLKGAKGDPGGLVMGTLIPDGADLWNYVTPGLYRKVGGSVVNGPTDLTQPYFSMMVLASEPGRVQQIIWPGATSQMGQVFWVNGRAGTAWSGWRATVTMRFDKTVGTSVYAWDPTADADLLVSGDTGELNATSLLGPRLAVGTGGVVRVRRVGNTVTWGFRNITRVPNGTGAYLSNIPVGFGISASQVFPVCGDSGFSVITSMQVRSSERDMSWYGNGTVLGDQYRYTSFSYNTADPWPSATPPQ